MFLNEINAGTKLGFNPKKKGYMKEEMGKLLVPIEIDNVNQLNNFENMSVSLRTIVAPKHTGGLRMSRDKGFKGAAFEHFSLNYFNDCELTYCIHKQTTALVTVTVRKSNLTRGVNNLDFHFMELITQVKNKLKNRKIKHISISVLINELPNIKCEFKIIRINGYYRKMNDTRRIRMNVIAYNHSDEVSEYYDNVATSGSSELMADPFGFESYLEKKGYGFNNMNQWLLSLHLDDLNSRLRMIDAAKTLLLKSNNTKQGEK